MAIIVQDNFTGNDNTRLENHNPNTGEVNSWTYFAYGQPLIIKGNKIKSSSGGVISKYYNNTQQIANGYCKITYTQFGGIDSDLIELLARLSNTTNYYTMMVFQSSIVIRKVVAGNAINLKIISDVAVSGDIYQFTFDGNNLIAIKNGITLDSIIDTTFSTGYIGFGNYTISETHYPLTDNFEAGTLAPSAPTNLTLACGV